MTKISATLKIHIRLCGRTAGQLLQIEWFRKAPTTGMAGPWEDQGREHLEQRKKLVRKVLRQETK